ncbi:exopolysaccharide biosynthesis polyprenyl glycosylphosphotransferase [Butyrivibrio sp. YAB3001]|nr:exopolysaccharide biosynthesis polyprenyl glycosylphosphotransferase [Butyrivibrio sp. YAB3001]
MFYRGKYDSAYHLKGEFVLYGLYAAVLFLMNRTYDLYSIGYRKVTDLIGSSFLAQVVTNGIIWVVSLLMFMKCTNPLPFMALCIVQLIIDVIWSIFIKKVYNSDHLNKKTVVVYEDDEDLERLGEIRRLRSEFDIQKYVRNPKDYKTLEKELEGYEAIVVSGIHATLRNGIVKYCIEKDIPGYFAPHVGDIIMQGSHHMQNFSVPIMNVQRAVLVTEYQVLKRLFDICVSLVALILTSPISLITAIVIKLYDGGPVFYKQVRLTEDRRKFKIIKFRSMRVDAEKDGIARLSTGANDSRITPVGQFIRACRIDELPQLWNILKGDMSIVGPRPERPEIAEQYEKDMPAFGLRLQVKAGLTGYAQVYGKYNTNPYDKLEMDLMYINRMSIVEDLRLMFATVRILFMPESTEGVRTGQITAKAQKGNKRETLNSGILDKVI